MFWKTTANNERVLYVRTRSFKDILMPKFIKQSRKGEEKPFIQNFGTYIPTLQLSEIADKKHANVFS